MFFCVCNQCYRVITVAPCANAVTDCCMCLAVVCVKLRGVFVSGKRKMLRAARCLTAHFRFLRIHISVSYNVAVTKFVCMWLHFLVDRACSNVCVACI